MDDTIIGRMQSNSDNSTSQSNDSDATNAQILAYLKAMAASLDQLAKNAANTSQASAKNQIPHRDDFRQQAANANTTRKNFRSSGRPAQAFADSFEDALLEGLLGSDFRAQISGAFGNLADMMGVEIRDIPGAIGKELGKQALSAFKDTKFGKGLTDKLDTAKSKLFENISKGFQAGADKAKADPNYNIFRDIFGKSGGNAAASGAQSAAGQKAAQTAASQVMGGAGGTVAGSAGTASSIGGSAISTSAGTAVAGTAGAGGTTTAIGGLAGGAAEGVAALGPYAAVVIALIILLDKLSEAVGPAVTGFQEFSKQLKTVANRDRASRSARQENEQARFEADIEAIVKRPFEILEEAANKVYEVWDANLRTINATQGYSKADLQSLMGSYAQRLRDENLSDVIASTDVAESLAKVLQSGLSGRVAEEFAYTATKLNAAIPTQDFFNYADEYASIAANAIKNGQSEAAAIALANKQLNTFASSVLYASRQLAGGFSSGLQDAESIFRNSIKIAQSAKQSDASQIGGVLTSISAIVGAIAPDLSSSIVDAVVSAATGGNTSSLVALRSLAGVNAGNTEFLKRLSEDPQSIFSALFTNLATLQNMSNDNYMEVAEGLSEVFGISMDALARVDFGYLAHAISSMKVNSEALRENMTNLKSGETTTTAEQLRIAQINKYMIDEGLAYVLDNDVARSIQENMWAEQRKNELMEAEYAVNLKGAALKLLEGIAETIQNIIDLINPVSWLKKAANVISTSSEIVAQESDIRQILELGKVGQGRSVDLNNLTSRGHDLNLTSDLVTLMGGKSAYGSMQSITEGIGTWGNLILSAKDGVELFGDKIISDIVNSISVGGKSAAGSRYTWGTVGKSAAAMLQQSNLTNSGFQPGTIAAVAAISSAQAAEQVVAKRLQTMLSTDYLNQYSETGYEDWAASAQAMGISNIEEAVENAGYSISQIKSYFISQQARESTRATYERNNKEENFWDVAVAKLTSLDEIRSVETNSLLSEFMTSTNDWLSSIFSQHSEFYDSWISYCAERAAERAEYLSTDVDKLHADEKAAQTEAISGLADAIMQSGTPTGDGSGTQTNVLLSQILALVRIIMEQGATSAAGTSLPDSLNGLALGLIR